MKKYLIPILSFFFIVSVASAFQPATLFIETWEGIKKEVVETKQQADKLFKDGYKLYQGDMFGDTSITTINGSDTLKDSRTVINNNFTSLNNNKVENSSYYATTTHANISSLPALTTIGTITTGFWNATAIPVNKGGTGTTTPNQYSVILGNGANGLTIASTTGTTGQFLTSNGANAYPSWQSTTVDQTANYTWTGTHTGIGIVGEIIAYASSTVPTGFLACNGQSVATTTYPNLFTLLGYTYGGSSANFLLPDLSGRNILGYGSTTPEFDAMGETGGATTTTLTIPQMPAHNHSYNYGYNRSGSGQASSDNGSVGTQDTNSTGDGLSHSNMDPFIVLQYIIKY